MDSQELSAHYASHAANGLSPEVVRLCGIQFLRPPENVRGVSVVKFTVTLNGHGYKNTEALTLELLSKRIFGENTRYIQLITVICDEYVKTGMPIGLIMSCKKKYNPKVEHAFGNVHVVSNVGVPCNTQFTEVFVADSDSRGSKVWFHKPDATGNRLFEKVPSIRDKAALTTMLINPPNLPNEVWVPDTSPLGEALLELNRLNDQNYDAPGYRPMGLVSRQNPFESNKDKKIFIMPRMMGENSMRHWIEHLEANYYSKDSTVNPAAFSFRASQISGPEGPFSLTMAITMMFTVVDHLELQARPG